MVKVFTEENGGLFRAVVEIGGIENEADAKTVAMIIADLLDDGFLKLREAANEKSSFDLLAPVSRA